MCYVFCILNLLATIQVSVLFMCRNCGCANKTGIKRYAHEDHCGVITDNPIAIRATIGVTAPRLFPIAMRRGSRLRSTKR
jgi:hypothetical protein